MSLQTGIHTLGPDNATLRVRTGRHGAAAKAGHDLVLEVTAWQATLDVGEDVGQVKLELAADPRSLRVREGRGGVQPLSEDDKADIHKTIDDDVLRGGAVEFQSTAVEAADGGARLRVNGDLDIAGTRRPLTFELSVGSDGQVSGSASVKQTDWGIKPYSALFGALKVTDEVEVEVQTTRLPA